jgi:hypothetical protein
VGSTSQLYVIDIGTGFATRKGSPFTPPLQGRWFGVDFNPVVDRLRIVSNTGQNLRLNPDTGAVASADKALNYAAGDVNAGARGSAVGAAYTNPDNDPTTPTVLYDIDSGRDVLAIQNPPNDGTLNTVGALGVGSGTREIVGFDIGVIGESGSATQVALAALRRPALAGISELFSIDLTTGQAQNLGAIGAITGLAISVPTAGK